MPYATIADLDGCPGEDCPLYEWCPSYKSHPSEYGPGCCADYPPDYSIEDAVDEVAGRASERAEYYSRKWAAEDALKAKKAEIQKKRRATLVKNSAKNKERARLRKRARIAERMGVTEKWVDLMGELMSIRRSIPYLSLAGNSAAIFDANKRIAEIGVELGHENAISPRAKERQMVANMVNEMMR